MAGSTAALRVAMAFAALAAVLLQAFVVQTHIHGSAAPISLTYQQPAAATHDASEQASTPGAHQQLCAICQVMASAGAATLPGATAALEAPRVSTAALIALALAPRTHTHSWQSRAPPLFL